MSPDPRGVPFHLRAERAWAAQPDSPRTLTVEDNGVTLGFLAIDSTVTGSASGGLRMMPDVAPEELARLARAMTLQQGFLGFPQGGAKAGVFGNPEAAAEERAEILSRFARAIRPFLLDRQYVPASGMGTDAFEIRAMLSSAGIPIPRRDRRRGPSGAYTAATVFAAARAAAAASKLPISGSRVVIEGFGKVGRPLAELFVGAGALVVAVSTLSSALYDPRGLDIARLCERVSQLGLSALDRHDPRKKISPAELKQLPAEIFCPCARHDTVQPSDIGRMAFKILSCGANSPIAPPAEPLLWERGILAVPDFVANCGGVLGGAMEYCGWSPQAISDFCQDPFRLAVERLIRRSLDSSEPLRALAERLALARFAETKHHAEQPSFRAHAFTLGRDLYRAGWIPTALVHSLSRRYFAPDQLFAAIP